MQNNRIFFKFGLVIAAGRSRRRREHESYKAQDECTFNKQMKYERR